MSCKYGGTNMRGEFGTLTSHETLINSTKLRAPILGGNYKNIQRCEFSFGPPNLGSGNGENDIV